MNAQCWQHQGSNFQLTASGMWQNEQVKLGKSTEPEKCCQPEFQTGLSPAAPPQVPRSWGCPRSLKSLFQLFQPAGREQRVSPSVGVSSRLSSDGVTEHPRAPGSKVRPSYWGASGWCLNEEHVCTCRDFYLPQSYCSLLKKTGVASKIFSKWHHSLKCPVLFPLRVRCLKWYSLRKSGGFKTTH